MTIRLKVKGQRSRLELGLGRVRWSSGRRELCTCIECSSSCYCYCHISHRQVRKPLRDIWTWPWVRRWPDDTSPSSPPCDHVQTWVRWAGAAVPRWCSVLDWRSSPASCWCRPTASPAGRVCLSYMTRWRLSTAASDRRDRASPGGQDEPIKTRELCLFNRWNENEINISVQTIIKKKTIPLTRVKKNQYVPRNWKNAKKNIMERWMSYQ